MELRNIEIKDIYQAVREIAPYEWKVFNFSPLVELDFFGMDGSVGELSNIIHMIMIG